MRKFKLYYDKDEEQVWLNKMCEEGWSLKKFFLGMYTFEKCEKGEYIYQIDLLDDKNSSGFLNFLEENGAEVVCIWGRWVTLRRKSCDGSFELYTDAKSKIEQYSRIKHMFTLLTISTTLIAFSQIVNLLNLSNSSLKIIAAIFVLGIQGAFLTTFLRVILKCNSKINNLK